MSSDGMQSGGLQNLLGCGGSGRGGGIAGAFLGLGLVAVVLTLIMGGCPTEPVLKVAPTSLHYPEKADGTYDERTFQVSNTGVGTLQFTLTPSQNWVEITQVQGGTMDQDNNYVIEDPAVVVTVSVAIDPPTAGSVGSITVNSNGGVASVSVTNAQDYYTQEFTTALPFNLANTTLDFNPDGSINFYSLATSAATTLPTDPTGGTPVTAQDFNTEDPRRVEVQDGKKIEFYGAPYEEFYVGSDGSVSFEDGTGVTSIDDHFAVPRVTGLSTVNAKAGGTVSVLQDSQKVAVTYENVPTASKQFGLNSFQIELFFLGRIRTTFLAIASRLGLTGLSHGDGTPGDYVPSDLLNTGGLKAAY